MAKNHNFGQVLTFEGLLYRLLPTRAKFGVLCRPTVYTCVTNLVTIGLFCRPLAAKSLNFARFWTLAFSDVANWHQSEKAEQGCKTTNPPLSNGIKIVSLVQRLHGEIGRTISDVQKRDGQTDIQTDRQTNKLETVSIAEPLQNRQHARLMLSTLERKGKREG